LSRKAPNLRQKVNERNYAATAAKSSDITNGEGKGGEWAGETIAQGINKVVL
jgi:hypothetical protein